MVMGSVQGISQELQETPASPIKIPASPIKFQFVQKIPGTFSTFVFLQELASLVQLVLSSTCAPYQATLHS